MFLKYQQAKIFCTQASTLPSRPRSSLESGYVTLFFWLFCTSISQRSMRASKRIPSSSSSSEFNRTINLADTFKTDHSLSSSLSPTTLPQPPLRNHLPALKRRLWICKLRRKPHRGYIQTKRLHPQRRLGTKEAQAGHISHNHGPVGITRRSRRWDRDRHDYHSHHRRRSKCWEAGIEQGS